MLGSADKHLRIPPWQLALLACALLLVHPLAAQDPAAQRLFGEAKRLEEAGDKAAAFAEYQLLAQQFAKDDLAPLALLRLATLKLERGDSAGSAETIDRLLDDHPRTPQAAAAFVLRGEAQAQSARGPADLEAARAEFRRVSLLFGADRFPALEARPRARVLAGELGLRVLDPAAGGDFLGALEDEPPGAWQGRAQLGYARSLLEQAEPKAAAEALGRLVGLGDDQASAAQRQDARRLLSLLYRRQLRLTAGRPTWTTINRFPTGAAAFKTPSGVAASTDGRVAVVDERQQLVALFGSDGRLLEGQTLRAQRPWWGEDGQLYVVADNAIVAPFSGARVQLLDPKPGKQTVLKGLLAGNRGPFGDWFVLAKGWKSLLTFYSGSDGRALLGADRRDLVDVTRDQQGRIYVLDAEAGQVVRLDLDRRNHKVVAAGSWKRPVALAVDDLGYIFVVDRGNRRVETFDPAGRSLDALGPSLGSSELRQPVDVAVDGSGRVLIADAKLPYLVAVE